MIRYALKCENDHRFESWFQSGAAFDDLLARNLVACPDCASATVSKDLMAPKLGAASQKEEAPQQMVSTPEPDIAEAIRKLRAHVEQNSDYVGTNFAREARAMHVGDLPHRPIYGEVDRKEAKSLIEDGVPAVPLPFIPRQKTN